MTRRNPRVDAGSPPVWRFAEHGFTLVEVLVALAIFGMLAAAGVALLSFSVRAQAAGAAKLDDVAALARLSSLLTADLAEAVDRPARDLQGVRLPAFVGNPNGGSTPLLRLVRGGWSNVDGAPRASVQKVEYRYANGAVERVAFPMVDGAVELPPVAVLQGVRNVTLRYRLAGAWSERWDGAQGIALPQAMELVVTQADDRVVRQLFIVGGGTPPPAIAPASPTAPEVPGAT